jgi:transposase
MIDALEAHEKRRPAMKKLSTVAIDIIEIFKGQQLTMGLDLGDRTSHYCILNEAGEVILEQKLPTTPEAMKQTFAKIPRSLIALETGTHSPWVSRLLRELGHQVLVAHAQKVQKRRAKDHRHYVVGKVVEVLRVRPESLLASRATGDNDAFAALSNRGWMRHNPAVPHDLCLGCLKNFAFLFDVHEI